MSWYWVVIIVLFVISVAEGLVIGYQRKENDELSEKYLEEVAGLEPINIRDWSGCER